MAIFKLDGNTLEKTETPRQYLVILNDVIVSRGEKKKCERVYQNLKTALKRRDNE